MLTLLKKAFEMYKAIFSQNKKVLLHIPIITAFHSKNAVQAGALTKPATLMLVMSDRSIRLDSTVWPCKPKHWAYLQRSPNFSKQQTSNNINATSTRNS